MASLGGREFLVKFFPDPTNSAGKSDADHRNPQSSGRITGNHEVNGTRTGQVTHIALGRNLDCELPFSFSVRTRRWQPVQTFHVNELQFRRFGSITSELQFGPVAK